MELRVISFNIRSRNDPDGYSIKERAPRLFSVTDSAQFDVMALQECVPEWKRLIKKHYRGQYGKYFRYRSRWKDKEGLALLWCKDKFQSVKTGCFWLSDTPKKQSLGWDAKYKVNRMCIYAILKDKESGALFTVVNTHFGFGETAQIKSAELIARYNKKISDYPTFVIGDFNMLDTSGAYAAMSKHFSDVNALTANNPMSTYHGYHPEKFPDYKIDYCFIDKQIIPLKYKVMDETVSGKFPSDHHGIFVLLGM